MRVNLHYDGCKHKVKKFLQRIDAEVMKSLNIPNGACPQPIIGPPRGRSELSNMRCLYLDMELATTIRV
uniref:Uncharacterized protein n=1 Tax=Helianthus annuus TaxID=4232 RepID=A0A251VTQ5_HELAN